MAMSGKHVAPLQDHNVEGTLADPTDAAARDQSKPIAPTSEAAASIGPRSGPAT